MKKVLLGFVAVSLIAGLPVMANDNVVVNGDFSQGDAGWEVANNGGTGGVGFGGGTATITGPDGAGPGNVEIWQNVTGADGVDTTISFDLVSYTTVDVGYTPAFDSPYVSINNNASGLNEDGSVNPGLFPGSGGQDGYGNLGEGDGQGSNIHYELNVAGTNNMRIAFGVDSADGLYGPGVMTVDNVSVKVPEPTTIGLLGLGALAMLRRRR